MVTRRQLRQIPVIGDDIYQVGQVLDMIAQPCSPDPWVMVQAVWSYSPSLIWSLFKPEVLDLAFDRAGKPHKRKRTRRFRVSDLMQLPAPVPGQLGWATFKLAEAGQRIGWYLLVLDATTDFAVNWTSMAYTYSGCFTPDSAWAETGSGFQFIARRVGPTTLQIPGTYFNYNGDAFASASGIQLTAPGPKTATLTLSGHVVPYLGIGSKITDVTLHAVYNGGGTEAFPLDQSNPADPASSWDFAVRRLNAETPAAGYYVTVSWDGGDLYIDQFRISGMAGPGQKLDPDP